MSPTLFAAKIGTARVKANQDANRTRGISFAHGTIARANAYPSAMPKITYAAKPNRSKAARISFKDDALNNFKSTRNAAVRRARNGTPFSRESLLEKSAATRLARMPMT